MDEALAARGLRRRVARSFPTFLAALWFLQGSDALLTVSRRLVAAVADRLPTRAFAPPLALPDYAVTLAWHPRLDRAPEDRWLRSRLIAAAEALAAEPPDLSTRIS